jgi:hypothetical protein
MAAAIEIDTPLPGDTISKLVAVSISYTGALIADQIECKLLDNSTASVSAQPNQAPTGASGVVLFSFTITGDPVNPYSVAARYLVGGNTANVADQDSVDNLTASNGGGGAIFVVGAPIPPPPPGP